MEDYIFVIFPPCLPFRSFLQSYGWGSLLILSFTRLCTYCVQQYNLKISNILCYLTVTTDAFGYHFCPPEPLLQRYWKTYVQVQWRFGVWPLWTVSQSTIITSRSLHVLLLLHISFYLTFTRTLFVLLLVRNIDRLIQKVLFTVCFFFLLVLTSNKQIAF